MRIVYDITQTAEMGLAGWPGLPVLMEENNELFPEETALWQGLAPREKHKPKKISGLEEKSGFWDLLCLVGESHESQYDVLRTNLTNSNSRMACLALSGQGFHGQRQRPWRALAGNLHLSISVPLEMESGPGALGWTMLPAVAMMRVLKEFGIEDPYGIKWVNDIFCGNKKMGGVISALSVSEGQIRRGFLGLGLNVAVSPQIDSETCCLHQLPGSENVSLGRVLQAVLEALAQLIRIFENNGGDQIFQEYAASSLVIGRLVRIVSDTETGVAAEICRGKVLAVNRDLSLQLEGMDSTVPSGRLHLLN